VDRLQNHLAEADLNVPQIGPLLALVQFALEECAEEDERFPLLAALESDLLRGQWPQNRIQRFSDRFPAPIQVDLEDEFRQLAMALPDAEWQTSQFLELDARLADFAEDHNQDALLDYLEARQQQLELALSTYSGNLVLPQEVTAETVVGHKLLTEGMRCWLQGVNLLIGAVPGGGDEEPGLAQVEQGNRLLIAVQRLNQRVHSQVATQSF